MRALIIVIVALLAGCQSATPTASPPPSPQPNYVIHTPPGYSDSKRYPLVLAFHGSPALPEDMIKLTKLNDFADSKGFIVVYPKNARVETVGPLLDELIAKYSVDTKRIHATGFSAGATRTYEVAEALTARFGSVAPVSGGGASDKPHTAPISLLTFQGGTDRMRQAWPVTNNNWAKASGCKDEKVTTITMEGGPTHRYTSTCDGGTEHIVYSVTQMGHQWPADANALIWDFFEKHPLR